MLCAAHSEVNNLLKPAVKVKLKLVKLDPSNFSQILNLKVHF